MKKILGILGILALFLFNSSVVEAGSLKVTTSSTTVTKGGSVTITVNASGLAGKFSVTSSNGNVLSGGTSGDWIEGKKSYKFTSKSAGTATITVNAIDVGDLENNGKFTGSRSIKITVVNPREKSSNNNLSSLSVDGFTLSPEFSKDTLEYSIEVPTETEKVTINATKADSYASLDGPGEKEVSEGDNRFEIKVTSETGKEKIYVVNVSVKDNNPINVKIEDEEYTVVKKASLLEKPELFEETKIKISDIEVPAFYNEQSDLTLVGLRDAEAKIGLYLYDSSKNTYVKYQPLVSSNISIIALPDSEEFKDYSRVNVEIGEESFSGYQVTNNSNYVYLYGQRIDTGTKSWYVYDKEEKTLQRYQDEELKKVESKYEEQIDKNKKAILCLGGLSIILSIIILLLVLFRKKSPKKKVQKQSPKKANNKKEEIVQEEDVIEEDTDLQLEYSSEIDLEQTLFDESSFEEKTSRSDKKSSKKKK